MRPSKLQSYMDTAELIAQRSHDAETRVGAILMDRDGTIIATGYNGFIRGACDTALPNTRPDKYQYIVHAEINIIAHCARKGIAMEHCTLVCTHSPCVSCMRALWQCGVRTIIIKEKYKDFDALTAMKDIRIDVADVLPEGFLQLTYSAR